MIPILEKFEKRFKFEKPIVVADAGLLSSENISTLTKNGYTFILGGRIKNETNTIKKEIEKIGFTDGHIVKLHKPDNTVLFVSYSDTRARKDKANRDRGQLLKWVSFLENRRLQV